MAELPIYARYKVYDSDESKWKLYYFETNTRQVLRVDKSDSANYPASDQFVSGAILSNLEHPNKPNSYLALVNGTLTYDDATYKDLKIQTQQGNLFLTGQLAQIQAVAGDITLLPKTGSKVYVQHGLSTEGYVQSGEVITKKITGKSGEAASSIEIFYGAAKTGEFHSNGLTLSTGKKISIDYTPSNSKDAVNKAYVDMVAGYGMNPIEAVKVATTKNITLSGTTGEGSNKIDGIFIQVGDRVLVKNQTNAKDNGVYIVASGAWERAEDAETPAQLTGGLVGVNHGNENKRCLFYQRSTVSTVGTSNQEWILFMNAADYYTALDGLYVTGNAFGINPGGVTEAKIATNAVTTTKIKDKNVTTDKIADKGVTTEKLADSAITTVKILDGNVTHAKLGNFAVTPSALPTSAVTGATLQTILGYYATQFKNVVGETNWYKAPVTSIKSLSNTLAGAQSQITGLLTSVADITTNLNGKQNTIAIGSTAPTSPADKNIWLDTAA
jgi:hypothetical protein